MNEREAWAAAKQRNEALGAAGETRRYAVARESGDGSWEVTVTSAGPRRSRWRSVREWLQSWKAPVTGPPPRDGDPESFDDEARRLTSPDKHVRRVATRDLARLFPDRAEQHVRERLDDGDAVVRSFAVQALEHITGRGGWTTYAEHLRDEESLVATAAWTAMRKHAGRGDIAELLSYADIAHPSVASAMRTRAMTLDARQR